MTREMGTTGRMNDVDRIVAQRIRALRLASGLKQSELAERLSVRPQQVHKYETGANRVSASRLLAIAEVFDVPLEHFFTGVERSKDQSARVDGEYAHLSDSAVMEMVVRYVRLSQPQRQAVLSVVQCMADGA